MFLFCVVYKRKEDKENFYSGAWFCYAESEIKAKERFISTSGISYRRIKTVTQVEVYKTWDC